MNQYEMLSCVIADDELFGILREIYSQVKEALIKSTCADLRQKFLLTRKKIAGILTDFKIF